MKKILIVEDEKDIIEIIKMSLEIEGFETATALNGKEGLEKIKTFKPDIIILDIIMDGMDGVTMKKNMTKDIPVIVASACDEQTRERIESEIKVNSWLEKPFEIDALVSEVRKISGEQ
ncbi:MAG: response regulator [Elusimicrobiota bacterium]|nr:response regulator [Elusimicrobiota bacterium]